MEFRRITNLPPYVFTIINGLKLEARRSGADVIDLGFGNPDIPSPDIAVEKLAEAARNPRNHRYSLSRGLPRLREEVAKYYATNWGVDLDPELEITNTIGSKEGFSHLMWVLLERGDAAIVPTPSYPIHMYGPLFAGADLRQVPIRGLSNPDDRDDFEEGFFESLHTAYEVGWPKPRVLVISFPHNPTGASVDLAFMQRVVDFCREREMIVVHDFAYADIGFGGVRPPSILQAEGAKEVAVEQYSMTKSFSMAGWRSAFMVGNAEVVQALVKLKSYLDYGMFQPVQIAATVVFRQEPDYPKEICSIYERRCDTLIDGLAQLGWDVPKPGGPRFVWAPIPEAYREMDSVEFCSMLVRECDVALSPGVGFGPGGEGFVRFALIENEQRITQAMRNLKRGLVKLG
ncbi:MAG: aminotransferase class I/II-fold pyridoxal phosphate-dependent enzyme [Ilumatobacteraceae bacterium]